MSKSLNNAYAFVVYRVFLIAIFLIAAFLLGLLSKGPIAVILTLGAVVGGFSLAALIVAGVRIGSQPLRRQK
jgi:hypothetical protein